MAKLFFEIVFWGSVAWIGFAYAGYPLFTLVSSWFVRRPSQRRSIVPTVSLLITAYNEERDILEKLGNSVSLDYPAGKLQIVVASDGSTDRTDELVRAFAARSDVPVVLHRVEGRVGKTATQNSAVEVCTGDIVVFSDAASMYEADAVRALVRRYADPAVGAVSGRCEYVVQRGAEIGLGAKLFWQLENFIKRRQSGMGTLTGATGCIYSVRRSLYVPLPREVVSDLVEPLMVLRQGYRVVFEPAAVAWEQTAGRPNEELKMRIRVIVGGMFGLGWALRRMDPRRHTLAWAQLVSHKVSRWLVPVFALTSLAASVALVGEGAVYGVALGLQVAFYAAAGLGWVAGRLGIRVRPLYLPLWVLLTNWASLVSLARVARGGTDRVIVWEPARG